MEAKNIESYSLPPQNTQYVPPPPPPPPPNIVQRLSGLIKSQLPLLQAIMVQVSSNYAPRSDSRHHYSKSPSRSRSRSK
ncbi:MAG TPA: hypothetical protein PLD02_16775, partial [Saprospiraceae bacterium]|jgi:hypothetical protein|nr:hypothetical protein [Saprospiraceae bacterium]